MASRRLARGALAVLATAGAVLAVAMGSGTAIEDLALQVQRLGAWGPLVFTASYALAVVAFVPGALLTLASGALFGALAGAAYAWLAASLGACLAFGMARHAARGWVERRLAPRPRLGALDRALASSGVRMVVLLRLSPVFQYNVLNYALGLTRVRFRDYALGCVGMAPATLALAYLGSLSRDVTDGGDSARAASASWPEHALTILGLLATLAALIALGGLARRALARLERGGW